MRRTSSFRPKIFYINTGYEYWARGAALIHSSVDGQSDVEPLPNERIYHLASGKHFVNSIPKVENTDGLVPPNPFRGDPLDFSVNYRALLTHLSAWVMGEKEPPNSRYPSIDTGELVAIEEVNWPLIIGMPRAEAAQEAYRVDYGPRWLSQGIVDHQPPVLGPSYPVLVPQVDKYGNEMAGIRNVELRVPLATYLPWHLRNGKAGGNGELDDFRGTWIPFAATEVMREAWQDPRPAIESVYRNRKRYQKEVQTAIEALVVEGFVLPADKDYVEKRALLYWEVLGL